MKALLILTVWPLALLLAAHANAGLGAETPPADAPDAQGMTQTVRLRLGQCHLDKADAGFLDEGSPEVRVFYTQGGADKVYSTKTQAPGLKGHDCRFDLDVDLAFDLGSDIRMQFVDVDLASDDVVFEKHGKADALRTDLAGGRVSGAKSWVEVKVVDPEGRYEVRLQLTLVATNDFLRVGGTMKGAVRMPEISDYFLHPKRAVADVAERIKLELGDGLEKCDHQVVVKQNGNTVFNSADVKPIPTGLAAAWSRTFELNWKRGDDLKVEFLDNDTLINDLIFSASNNHESSISLLQGTLSGGDTKQSHVVFTTRFLGP